MLLRCVYLMEGCIGLTWLVALIELCAVIGRFLIVWPMKRNECILNIEFAVHVLVIKRHVCVKNEKLFETFLQVNE